MALPPGKAHSMDTPVSKRMKIRNFIKEEI